VTIPASGRQLLALENGLAVKAVHVFLANPLMAIRAFDILEAELHIGGTDYIMAAVTFPAVGDGFIIGGGFLSMHTLADDGIYIIMTAAAIHGFEILIMRKVSAG
jgi:hypothetical protein